MSTGRVLTPEYEVTATWSVEGRRVAGLTCLTCGAALITSMQTDVQALHDAWHAGEGRP